MSRRIYFCFGILVQLETLCLSRPGYAQSQSCLDTAPPSRTLMPETKINIVSVEFQGENPLSDAQREQLIKHIQQQDLWITPEEPDSNWVNRGLKPMRDALRERGYFRNNVEGAPYLVLAQANERRYVLSVSIESGPQYRLWEDAVRQRRRQTLGIHGRDTQAADLFARRRSVRCHKD